MGAAFPTLLLFALLALALGTLVPGRLQVVAAALLLPVFLILSVPEPTRSWSIQRWLETRYDRSRVDTLSDPAGIIVLGGGLATYVVDATMGLSLDDRGRSGRITGAASLARRFPQAKVVHTGEEQPSAADVLAGLGIARDRIVIEDRSSTTFENATFTAALLKPQPGQRWILVTSASHMPRAMATFRTAGFDVVAYPVDFEADPAQAPPEAAMRAAAQPAWPRGRRELLAILGYLATGRISMWKLWP
jgi:uncharacterized SAM-binding protein YcdF (DUF218 family)